MSHQCQTIGKVFNRCFSVDDRICEEHIGESKIAYVFSGVMTVTVNKTKITVKSGECVLLRRNHTARMEKRPSGQKLFHAVFLYINPHSVADMNLSPIIPCKLKCLQLGKDNRLTGFFESIDKYFSDKTCPSKALVKLKMQEIITLLSDKDSRAIGMITDCIANYKPDLETFMRNNFTRELTLEEFAQFTGRSLSAFKRDFSEAFGRITPSRWIMGQRLDRAKSLIEEGKSPMEIYLQIGFKNLSHFSTAFKKRFGFSPSQYKFKLCETN